MATSKPKPKPNTDMDEATSSIHDIAENIKGLGSKNTSAAAENLYRISKGLSSFSDIDSKKITKNLKDLSKAPDLFKDLNKALKTGNLDVELAKSSIAFGKSLQYISQGLKAFSEVSVSKLAENIKDISSITGIVTTLTKSFSGDVPKDFYRNSYQFGNSVTNIAGGLKSISELSVSKLVKNVEDLKMLPNLMGDLVGSFSAKVSKTFTNSAKNFGDSFLNISEGLSAFSELSMGKLLKNLVAIRLIGPALKFLNSIPKIKNLSSIGESFKPLTDISAGLVAFSELKFGSLIKNLLLLKVFGKTLGFLSSFSKNTSSLKKAAEDFGAPLKEIADSLKSFSEIKWGKVLLSTALFKVFNKLFFKGNGKISIMGSSAVGKSTDGNRKLMLLQLSELNQIKTEYRRFIDWWMGGDMARQQDQDALLEALAELKPDGTPAAPSGGGSGRDDKPEEKKGFFAGLLDKLWNSWIPTVLGSLAFIPGAIIGFVSQIGKILNETFLGRWFTSIKGAIKGLFAEEGALSSIGKLFSKEGMFGGIITKIGNVFSKEGAIGGIFSKLTAIFEASALGKSATKFFKFGKIFGSILGKIALPLQIVMSLYDSVKGFLRGFKEEGIVGGIKGAIVGLVDGLLGFLIDIPMHALGWLAGVLGFDNIAPVLKAFSFKDNFQMVIDTVFDAVGDFFTWMTDGISGVFSGALSGDMSSIMSLIFPGSGLLSMLVPDSIKENISEFFKEMVRSILPDPGKSFIGKLLSNVIPDSVYQWAGINPKTGALLPADKLNQFVQDQGDSKKSAKEIMQQRKDLKAAGYTDEMIDSASDKKAQKAKEEADIKFKEEEKKKKLDNRAAARAKTKEDEKYGKDIKAYEELIATSNNTEEISAAGKGLLDKGLSQERLTKIFDEQYLKRNAAVDAENVKATDVKVKPVLNTTLGIQMAEKANRDFNINPDAKPAAVKVGAVDPIDGPLSVSKEELDKKYGKLNERNVQANFDEAYGPKKLRPVTDGWVTKPPVVQTGQAMNVLSADNEAQKQNAMTASIASSNNSNVTNNASSSSTTVVNSNIPDRTFASYGRHGR
jgi:hypothetical protein